MPKVSEVCRHVRSKNAGPFWITLDLSFPDVPTFNAYAGSPSLQPAAIGALFSVDPTRVKHFLLDDLLVVKISYPRTKPQGGAMERDMHGGQQYVQLLDVHL
ncbi:DUF4387 domain-containing protein [Variovorax sp. NFACC27]|uniref:DUF4387 domain-containing protein n=1 Tax=unclassified Variovorax TaxID=663243 RepID=UPI00089B0779|nr:protein of unknown function [Variovorax sp. NFACC28]SEG70313.1 protein of unknown function [Variovorax sp. NFACC29]SFC82865.1 protein of unknown function [Variovorax sp. NFACC26]SFF98184.1 protein of unknown function [Variovorax sp. NFACC27]